MEITIELHEEIQRGRYRAGYSVKLVGGDGRVVSHTAGHSAGVALQRALTEAGYSLKFSCTEVFVIREKKGGKREDREERLLPTSLYSVAEVKDAFWAAARWAEENDYLHSERCTLTV